MKLLIADDQNSVHLFLNQMLPFEELGITEVFNAKNGQEALEIIKEEWPELLIIDIQMPVMNGITLLEKISILEFEHRVLILSAYNEFEYARKCMVYGVKDYLLKPIDIKEMKQLLQKNIAELKKQQIRSWSEIVMDFLDSGKEDVNKIPNDFGKNGFGVIVQKNGEILDLDEKQVLLRLFVQAMTISFVQISSDDTDGNSESEWEGFYRNQTEKNREILIGFSKYHKGRDHVFQGIREGMEAIWQGFYEPGCCMFADERWTKLPVGEVEQFSERLAKNYKSGNVQEMKQAVEQIFFIFQRGRVHPKFVQEFCYSVLIRLDGNFMEAVRSLKGSLLTDEFLLTDASSLKNTFLRLMLSMRLEIEPESVRMDEDVIRQIRRYIDTNYDKDLSLSVLAKHYFISKYQISRLFKKEFDINLSDYVLKVRMEAAGMMLRNSSWKLDEIARKVGFEETSYFSRVFSKYYEVSPGEYRKNKKKEIF